MLVMFSFFRRQISDLPRPIAAKLCHMIGTGVNFNKKLSYCWETVRRESMPRIAEMDEEITT